MTNELASATAQQRHLQASAALLEQAYRLALALQVEQADGSGCDMPGDPSRISQELLGVIDEARAALVNAATSTPLRHSATLRSG
jgi:hypothetical protein